MDVRHPRRVERAADLVRRLADEIRAVARAERLGEWRVRLALAAAAEDDVQARVGEGRERALRGGDVRGLRVVHVADAAELAHELDAVRHAGEGAERLRDGVVADARRARGRGRGRRVLAVVHARDQRLRRQRVVEAELHPARGARNLAEAARDDGRVVLGLRLEDPELRVDVPLERAVPVEMVGLEVEEDGDARTQRLDVLELERGELADDPRVLGHAPDERR